MGKILLWITDGRSCNKDGRATDSFALLCPISMYMPCWCTKASRAYSHTLGCSVHIPHHTNVTLSRKKGKSHNYLNARSLTAVYLYILMVCCNKLHVNCSSHHKWMSLELHSSSSSLLAGLCVLFDMLPQPTHKCRTAEEYHPATRECYLLRAVHYWRESDLQVDGFIL